MTISSQLSPTIIWPNKLEKIKLNEKEKNIIEVKIKELQKCLPAVSTVTSLGMIKDLNCPRRLNVGRNFSLVVLNKHGGMECFPKSGKQQKDIKYVWDCVSGSFWLKKKLLSDKQADCLKYLLAAPDVGFSALGLPKLQMDTLSKMHKQKLRYFEKLAPFSLPEWLKKFKSNFQITEESILGLMDALKKIHRVRYNPASFQVLGASEDPIRFDLPHTLFHGDISPNNILCEDRGEGTRFMLTDFYGIGDLKLVWTNGWASPESIQFIKKSAYQDMSERQFCAKYGAKKDTWAMGLLIGSILRGGMARNRLPHFSFITNKTKWNLDAKGKYVIDDSEIANITQEEVDDEIDRLRKKVKGEGTKRLWDCVKKYLTVNPDERPTMAE